MISSLKYLSFKDEHDLKDMNRLEKLFKHSEMGTFVVVISVGLFLMLPLLVLMFYFLFYAFASPASLYLLLVDLFLAIFLFFGWIFIKSFIKEIQLNPIPAFLKNPHDFEFLPGVIEKLEYSAGSNRVSDRMIAYGSFSSQRMEKNVIIELFKPQAWPYKKGTKEKLVKFPLKVMVLSEKREPYRSCLVGIEESLLH